MTSISTRRRNGTTRRVFLGSLALALARPPGAVARAGDIAKIEDWRRHTPGTRGIPEGWEAYATPGGRPAYDLTVITTDGRRALHMKSRGDRSTIARSVDIDLTVTPVLEWSWKAIRLPHGADVRRSARSDLTAHLLVVWPRVPKLLRSRILAYAWDTTAPANTIQPSHKTSTVTFIIVRSGQADIARWLTERRDVYADYRAVYGEDPDPVRAVALSIDSNDTATSTEAYVGAIAFRKA